VARPPDALEQRAATDFGDPTCTTRSRCGMSIPSSRLVDVVTTSSVPAFSPSSIRVRWASPRPVVTARVRLVVAEPLAKLSKGAFGARPRVREH